jgi:hypothetical protein
LHLFSGAEQRVSHAADRFYVVANVPLRDRLRGLAGYRISDGSTGAGGRSREHRPPRCGLNHDTRRWTASSIAEAETRKRISFDPPDPLPVWLQSGS